MKLLPRRTPPIPDPMTTCFFHGEELDRPGDFHVCGECRHIFRTESELVEKDYMIRLDGWRFWRSDEAITSETEKKLWQNEPPPERRPSKDINVCPLCTHDF